MNWTNETKESYQKFLFYWMQYLDVIIREYPLLFNQEKQIICTIQIFQELVQYLEWSPDDWEPVERESDQDIGFLVRAPGLKIRVPTNATLNHSNGTLTYKGDWDGVFKLEHSSDLAWVMHDWLLSRIYGACGCIIPDLKESIQFNKWRFYDLSKSYSVSTTNYWTRAMGLQKLEY